MSIKLVAVDMDGTLLNNKKEMPADFIPWVKNHPEIKTVIASGRQYYTLEKDFLPVRDQLIFIAENGGLVFEKGEIIFKDPMKKEDILNCLDIVEQIPLAEAIVCGAKAAYFKEPDEVMRYNAEMYYKSHEIVEDLRQVPDRDTIIKIAVFVREHKAEETMQYFKNPGKNLSSVLSGPSWIDVANVTESKGNAVKAIQERYHIRPEESMAFGDYLNDLTLIKSCTESYCMKNGHPVLKDASKYVTEKTNDEEGVMEVLKKII
ncbi:MAG: HAD family hydrolase [Lachnospiraceae bacterium]|nr:HAD family hydrolase [Lachnospiraceae bacterium]